MSESHDRSSCTPTPTPASSIVTTSSKPQSPSVAMSTTTTVAVTNPTSTSTSARAISNKIPQELKHLISGGLAGMIAKTVVAPMDRIKILYQVTSTPFRLRDVPSVAMNIVNQEGVNGLWRGNTATMIRVFPYAGIQFMVFNRMKTFFADHPHFPFEENGNIQRINENNSKSASANSINDRKWSMTALQSLFAGSVAGAISVLMTYPLDLTRAQLAVLKKQKCKQGKIIDNTGFSRVLFSNYNNGGFTGLFRGITPTLLGMLPYAGVAFAINEQTKRQIYNLQHRDPTVVEKMICGGLSGLVAQSMTYPLEVTRRRMQTIGIISTTKDTSISVLVGGNVETKAAYNAATIAEHHVKEAVSASGPSGTHTQQSKRASSLSSSPSMIRIMKQVMKEQGVNGFFKGLSMNWLKGPVSFAISFTAFDLIKELIDREESELR